MAPPRRHPKGLELWFPSNGVVELCAVRADAPIEPAPETRPLWIHHGSSISQCDAASSPTRTWPAIAARLGGFDLLNLGFGGQCCHLDPFVARTIRDLPAAFISLKIGVNITQADSLKFRTFGPTLHGFLDTIRDGHPNTPILLVSPIVCPLVEDRPGPIAPDGTGPRRTPRRRCESASDLRPFRARRTCARTRTGEPGEAARPQALAWSPQGLVPS
jgi:hypothetical protein